MASQARPWRRLPSMVRPPALIPADPSPAAPPARPLAAMPTFRAASPPLPPAPQPQGEPTPPPPAASAAAASTVSVPSTPVSRPVAAAPVPGSLSSLPPSPARGTSPPAVTKPPLTSPGVSGPTSAIQSQNGLSTSSSLPPPLPSPPGIQATTVVVPVQAPVTVSRHEVNPVPSPPRTIKPEAEAKTPTKSPKPMPVAEKKVSVHENFPLPIHKQHSHGETHRESVNGDTKKHHDKKHLDSVEAGMRVITIAGENRGAVMELLVRSPKTSSFLHRKANRSDGNEQESSGSSGGEGKQKTKDDKTLKPKASMLSPPTTAFMNSNVQGINNSIVFNSSFTHHDPGIHLSFSRNPPEANYGAEQKS